MAAMQVAGQARKHLPDGAREIIRLTVEGNRWADASSIRGSIPGEGTSQYDLVNPSYQHTTGFIMPEALLPAFRAAINQL